MAALRSLHWTHPSVACGRLLQAATVTVVALAWTVMALGVFGVPLLLSDCPAWRSSRMSAAQPVQCIPCGDTTRRTRLQAGRFSGTPFQNKYCGDRIWVQSLASAPRWHGAPR